MKPVVIITTNAADWGLYTDLIPELKPDLYPIVLCCGDHSESVAQWCDHPDNDVARMSYEFDADDIAAIYDEDTSTQAAQFLSSGMVYGMLINLMEEGSLELEHIIVLGDRAEMLLATHMVNLLDLKIHHLYAGEVSGCRDNLYRSMISMLSDHLYYVDPVYGENLKMLPKSAGAKTLNPCRPVPIETDLSICPKTPYAVMRFHPETSVLEDASPWIEECVFRAIKDEVTLIAFPPNSDQGFGLISECLSSWSKKGVLQLWAPRYARAQYLGLLQNARWIAGNSSSFIAEAPLVNKNVKIYGHRQNNRHTPEPMEHWPSMASSLITRIKNDA